MWSRLSHTQFTQSRFNIYPEVIVGFLYRAVKSTPWLATLLADALTAPSAFYYLCVFAWSGVSVASVFMTGFVLSGRTVAGGLLAALVFVVNYKFSTQVQWSPTLRECWALPLGHALMALLVHWFSLADADVRPRHYAAIGVVLVLALVPWQFTPFMLLAQVLSIYSTSVIGFVSLERVAALFRVYAGAYVVAAVLMFGQLTFLHSFSFCFVAGVLVLEYALRATSVAARVRALAPRARWLVEAVVLRGVGAVAAFLCVFVVAKLLIDTHANSHVSTFMSIKLRGLLPRLSELASGQDKFSGGAPPSFAHIHDFDTLMYVCQTEFDFMPVWAALRILRLSLLVQLSVASMALVAFQVAVLAVRQWRAAGSKRAAADESELAQFALDTELSAAHQRRAAELFMVAQSISFLIYAVMVERFAVLSTPAFSALCGVLASAELPFAVLAFVRRRLSWPVPSVRAVVDARIVHQLLALLVVLGVALHNRDLLQSLAAPVATPLPHDIDHQVSLMRFIFRNTPANASFSASMPLVSAIRLITHRAVTMHPQYESADTRLRIRKVYQLYGLMPLADVHRLLRDELRTDYVVLEMDYCNGQMTNNCMVVDMVDEYRHHQRWTADQVACKRLQALPQSNAMFEQVFANPKFIVFKVKK
jgi:hypothetical protein